VTPASAKAKGRKWEAACALWLRTKGYFDDAKRRRQTGAKDEGDLDGITGVVAECKHERTYKPQEWLREAEAERINAGVPVGFVWVRSNGQPDPGEGHIIMRPDVFFDLLRRAGHLPAPRWND
jgi:hypothetical protein